MRRSCVRALLGAALATALGSCTNVNRTIYFDESRMEEALGRLLAEVRGVPAPPLPQAVAEAAVDPGKVDLRAVQMETPAIFELRERMRDRFVLLVPLYDEARIGDGRKGEVELLRSEDLDANQLAGLEDLVGKENEDRVALIRAIIGANAYSEGQSGRIRTCMARTLRALARPGWRFQTPDERWRWE
ncbi:MAG: DUF1318 domain-containing protein [Planctomycetes bacterium]|nr:DUF1318 domain-containing protein [Planctomycetota bacterium]